MFGRVRASPVSSSEPLDSERLSCKIIKHDSLSIYESTLLKLKQGGSRCNPSIYSKDSARTDAFCIVAIDDAPEESVTAGASRISTDSRPESSSSVQSTASSPSSSNEGPNTNMSILHFFSKHKSVMMTHTRNLIDNQRPAEEKIDSFMISS
ncbi:hypothetical protein OROHE_007319 [Orobanche hederae]